MTAHLRITNRQARHGSWHARRVQGRLHIEITLQEKEAVPWLVHWVDSPGSSKFVRWWHKDPLNTSIAAGGVAMI